MTFDVSSLPTDTQGWTMGVDLGRFHTTIASSSEQAPFALGIDVNALSNRSTPSCVAYSSLVRLVGEEAVSKLGLFQPQCVMTHEMMAALVEGKEDQEKFQDTFGFPLEEGKVGPIQVGGKDLFLSVEEFYCVFFEYLKKFASGGKLGSLKACVIAVPDSFSESACKKLKTSSSLGGIENASFVKYSDAIVSSYLHSQKNNISKSLVLFVDVGSSHTTATLASFEKVNDASSQEASCFAGCQVEVLKVLTSTHASVENLVFVLEEEVRKKHHLEPSRSGGKFTLKAQKQNLRLRNACQKALKELAMMGECTVEVEAFTDDMDLHCEIKKDDFDLKAKGTLDALREMIAECLKEKDSFFQTEENSVFQFSVEVVGGGSRIPSVQQVIQTCCHKGEDGEDIPLGKKLDGSAAVACGAAAIAAASNLQSQASESEEVVTWVKKVEGEELKRLETKNDLEAWIYKVRGWLGSPDRSLLSPEASEPFLEQLNLWFEDRCIDDDEALREGDLARLTPVEVYNSKFEEAKQFIEEKGALFMEKLKKESERVEAELTKGAEEEAKKTKDDHDFRKLPPSERLRLAGKNKEEGNLMFKGGNLQEAIVRYQKALGHIQKVEHDIGGDVKAEADKVVLSCNLNLSQCFIKVAQTLAADTKEDQSDKVEMTWRKAKNYAEEALKVDGDNQKAAFRLASALEKLGLIDEGVSMLGKLTTHSPEVLKMKQRFDLLLERQENKRRKMFSKMLG